MKQEFAVLCSFPEKTAGNSSRFNQWVHVYCTGPQMHPTKEYTSPSKTAESPEEFWNVTILKSGAPCHKCHQCCLSSLLLCWSTLSQAQRLLPSSMPYRLQWLRLTVDDQLSWEIVSFQRMCRSSTLQYEKCFARISCRCILPSSMTAKWAASASSCLSAT